jgi:amidase
VIQPKGRKPRLGLVGPHDSLVTCHPPVERALDVVKKSLESQDPEIVKNLLAAFYNFGGGAIMTYLGPYNEPVFPAMTG